MSSVSSFFTQATNFSSAVSGGVDPRTGLFNIQIALGNLVGNRNLGPSLPLVMSYSPLTKTDAGFGQSVSLGLTTYDTHDRLLVLATGEQYRVYETATNVILQQNKLDTVRVAKDQGSYRIVHKSGDVEILTGRRNAFSLKVPTAVLTPAGHRLTLTWDFTSGARPRLKEIKDKSDTLLAVDYTDQSKVTLRVLPDQPEGYGVELWLQNGQLGSVHHFGLGPNAPLVWSFTYNPMGQRGEWGSWITGISMPGGMTETAYYRNDGRGHQFPSLANLPALPYVYRFVQAPGGGQPAIEASYRYTGNNFLGGHSGVSWDPGRDNLYEILTSYSYGSMESRVCGGQTTTITREYNQYHLQTVETRQQNGCRRDVRTDYYAVVGQPFDKQPAQFQLPKTRAVTWTDPQGNSRSELTQTSFDTEGNPQSQTEPDGTRTEWTYYPATGSGTECPPEPNGFTRLLARVTRTPPQTGFDAPVHTTSYRYAAYTGTPDKRVSTAVLKSEELRYSDNQLLTTETFTYSTSREEFGRITRLVETEYPSEASGASYTATHAFGFSVQQDALVQTHTLTTHDQLTVTRSQTRSRFTGRLRSATDPQATVATTTYDRLGRELTHTQNPGTPYQAVRTHAYTIGDTNAPFVEATTDALGNQLRETLDGAGRPIRRERKDIDGDGTWHTVQTQSYDKQGRASSITALDHLPGSSTEIGLTQTFSYDDWGQLSTTASNDGSSELTRTDPVGQTTTTQRLGGGTPVTGTEVTTHNTRGAPVKVERFDLKGLSAGRRTLARDGWGRLRRETDELSNTTRYDYDPRGRLVRTTLPEGTQLSCAYAPFTSDALITGLTVGTASYGTQSFDGLGRLTATSSGGRSWSYRYTQVGDPLPSTVIAPDQQVRAYQFIPQLGNTLSQVQAGSITQQITHDPVSGFVTKAQAGGITVTRGYSPSGLPRTETTTLSGQPDATAQWGFTLNGLEHSYTDVDGTTQRITRDDYGRISAVTDPAMRVSVSYDTAGRVTGWTTQDRQSAHTLTTALTLDDFGREIQRTITDSQRTSWTLTQAWQQNDLLSHRTLSRGDTTLREESFTYNSRNQLTGYTCAGSSPPRDDHGNAVTRQTFTHDSYCNITRCQTDFTGGTDTATYLFENPSDPCQLTSIHHTHPTYPSQIKLAYDGAGRLITDDAGRALTYDPLGRLRSVGSASQYGYDPLDRLLTQETSGHTSVLYYRGESFASVIEDGQRTRLLRFGQACVAQRREGPQAGTWLLATDAKQTVLAASAGQQHEEYAYTVYGHRPVSTTGSVLGYDGQRTDPATGWYYLGNGARAYHPVVMRFTTPDTLSPFGAGGINPYTYCLGDPVNRIDPSGHLSWQAWLGIGLGVAGLALTVVTGGMAIVAAGGVMAAISAASTTTLAVGALGVASDVTAITSGALEEASPKASSILGWVSLGTGLAGLAHAGVNVARGISGLASALRGTTAERTLTWTGRLGRFHQKPGVFQPEIRLITDAEYGRYYKWKRYPNPSRGGGDVFLTKFETNGNWVRDLLKRKLPERPADRYLILSGTHGNEAMIRDSAYHELNFYNQDVDTANRLRQQYSEAIIDVRQMRRASLANLSTNVVDADLTNDFREYDVIIGAFCYSRNDSQLMPRVGLTPSTSYVTPPWP